MRYRWELALIGATAVWGATFTVVQDAIELIPPFLYLALRFAVAVVALAVIGAFRGLGREEALAGIVLGTALWAGYGFQTVGLQYTSPSNSGFITGLFVVFTPLLGALLLRRLPASSAMVGVALATGGLVLLAMPDGFTLNKGDGLTLLCALTYAVHIVLLGRLAPGFSALRLAGVQIATCAVFSGVWTAIGERQGPGGDGTVWFAVLLTGILATAVGFFVQTRAQQSIAPTRTAVLLTAEPVFAGIFGYLVAGDRLGARGYAGAALIMVGILVAELLAPAKESV